MAASQCTMNNFTFGNDTYQYYETISGGSGAGPGFDGASVVQTHMTNSRLTDPEVLEFRFPVRLDSYAIRAGSGGAGRHRGGDGGVRRVRFLEPMTASILSNGRRVPAFGLAGGAAGRAGHQPRRARRRPRRDAAAHRLGRDAAGRRVRDRNAGRRRLRAGSGRAVVARRGSRASATARHASTAPARGTCGRRRRCASASAAPGSRWS